MGERADSALERMAASFEKLAEPAATDDGIANWLASVDPDELHKQAMRRAVKTSEPVMVCALEVLKEWAGGHD